MNRGDDPVERAPLLQIMDGGTSPISKLKEFRESIFDASGKNFLGSGMDFSTCMATLDILKFHRYIGTQPKHERERRMKYVVALSAEQERIVAFGTEATALSLMIIEAVIDGDWDRVWIWISPSSPLHYRDTPSDPWLAEHMDEMRKRFVPFLKIAQEAYDTRPKVYCPRCWKAPEPNRLRSFRDGRHVCGRCEVVFDDAGTAVELAKANLEVVPTDGGAP